MGYVLGSRSRNNLVGVHPDLVKIVQRAIEITKQDFMVLEGVRTLNRQYELYSQGRTVAQLRAAGVPGRYLPKPGPVVTWTLRSNHFVNAKTGFGHAVDLVPFPVDWNDHKKFDAVADAMFAAAKELGVKLRWGADWNSNGKRRERGETDSPHFEIL